MGIIYKLTSPAGRCYIGKTVLDMSTQWKQHVATMHKVYRGDCRVLNKAIKKHGHKHFKVEVLEECDDTLLDTKEIYYIQKLKTMVPYGMNVNVPPPNEEEKWERINKMKDLVLHGNELPKYLVKEEIGYSVCDHPMGPTKRFMSKLKTEEHHLKKALKYLDKLNQLEEPLVEDNVILPKYVYCHRNGYCVRYPGDKNKYFVSRTIPNDELYKSAVEYVNELMSRVKFND